MIARIHIDKLRIYIDLHRQLSMIIKTVYSLIDEHIVEKIQSYLNIFHCLISHS